MLGLPNKVPYADFMARYSIVAPKIFSEMAADPKGCANKALPTVGMDPDDFRTGHTKVEKDEVYELHCKWIVHYKLHFKRYKLK